jgi:hypothetical protein
MKLYKEMVEDFVKLPSLTETQVEFIKLLEGTDLPATYITDLVTLAKDTPIEGMRNILDGNHIFVKKIFLERHPEFAEELKGM